MVFLVLMTCFMFQGTVHPSPRETPSLWELSHRPSPEGGDPRHGRAQAMAVPTSNLLSLLSQARYRGLVFLHPGWPLCAHEKVVVQLASLHGVRLQPGDFYLQVTSAGKQSARLVLKCLSQLGRGTEEVTIPEAMYGCVFTGAFLEWVNQERSHVPLHTCLLTSGLAVHRAPWSDITNPVFVPSPGAILQSCSSCTGPEQLPSSPSKAPAPTQAMAGPHFQGSTPSPDTLTPPCRRGCVGSDQLRHLPYPETAELGRPRTLSGSSDRDFEKVSPSEQGPRMPPENCGELGQKPDPMNQEDGPKTLTFHTDLDIPSSRRRPPGDSSCVQPRRWFRESYMEALRNPMPLGSSEEALGDPACSSLAGASRDPGTGTAASGTQEETSGTWGDPQQTPSLEKERHTPSRAGPGAAGRTLPRRSRSRERAPRSSRGAQAAACHTSHHSAGARPGGHLGGQAVGTPNCVPVEGPGCIKEEGKCSTPPPLHTPQPPPHAPTPSCAHPKPPPHTPQPPLHTPPSPAHPTTSSAHPHPSPAHPPLPCTPPQPPPALSPSHPVTVLFGHLIHKKPVSTFMLGSCSGDQKSNVKLWAESPLRGPGAPTRLFRLPGLQVSWAVAAAL